MPEELHKQLRHRAWILADRSGPPSQIMLWRAVSAAYYAVFHRLVHATVTRMVPDKVQGLRVRAGRALQHGEMKEVCNWFRKPTPPDRLKPLLPAGVPQDLQALASTFVDLQEERHRADYDTATTFVQSDVVKLPNSLNEAFACWERAAGTPEADVFLAALVFGRKWDR